MPKNDDVKIADELGVKLVYCDKKYIPFFKD